jgi:hypothetical protein
VNLHRPGADVQVIGDRLVRQPGHEPVQDLDWGYVLIAAVLTVVIFVIGVAVFKRSVPRVLKEI